MKIGDIMFLQVKLLSLPDRTDTVQIKIPNVYGGTITDCSSFYLTNNKTNTELILRMLKHEFEKEISECKSIADCEVLTRVYKKAEKIIEFNQ